MSEPWTHVRLVRHGEVAAEHRGSFYGGAEVPLSHEGEIASAVLAARLAAEDPPDAVFSSHLSRTLAVAEPLAAVIGVELQVDPDLRELDRGSWTYKSKEEIEARKPGAIAAYLSDPETGNAPDGETESAFAERVWAAMDRAHRSVPGGRIVVVTHGHVIRVTMRRLLGWQIRESLTRFVPYHAIVETRLRADGTGEVLSAPDPVMPPAFREPPSP